MRTYRWIWNLLVGGASAVVLAGGVTVLPAAIWILLACLAIPFGMMLAIGSDVPCADQPRSRGLRVAKVSVGGYLALVASAVLLKVVGSAAFGILGLLLVASPPAVNWYGQRVSAGRKRPLHEVL
jgi:hypothetical protein